MSRPHHAAGEPGGTPEVDHDADLLARIADGDPDAFTEIWRRYGRPVHALCRAVLGEPAAAEDAAQETFLRIWRRAGTYAPARGVPAAWIMTIARNTARSAARPAPFLAPVPPRAPPDALEATIDRLWMSDALGALPERERLALELAYFADLSHAQVAARLGEPLGTVKARIRRALLHLSDRAGGR